MVEKWTIIKVKVLCGWGEERNGPNPGRQNTDRQTDAVCLLNMHVRLGMGGTGCEYPCRCFQMRFSNLYYSFKIYLNIFAVVCQAITCRKPHVRFVRTPDEGAFLKLLPTRVAPIKGACAGLGGAWRGATEGASRGWRGPGRGWRGRGGGWRGRGGVAVPLSIVLRGRCQPPRRWSSGVPSARVPPSPPPSRLKNSPPTRVSSTRWPSTGYLEGYPRPVPEEPSPSPQPSVVHSTTRSLPARGRSDSSPSERANTTCTANTRKVTPTRTRAGEVNAGVKKIREENAKEHRAPEAEQVRQCAREPARRRPPSADGHDSVRRLPGAPAGERVGVHQGGAPGKQPMHGARQNSHRGRQGRGGGRGWRRRGRRGRRARREGALRPARLRRHPGRQHGGQH